MIRVLRFNTTPQ